MHLAPFFASLILLLISSTVSISSSHPNFQPMQLSVNAQSTLQIQVNDTNVAVCDFNKANQKGLLVRSTQPVSVYVDMEMTNGDYFTNFLALPTNLLGKEYPLSTKWQSNLVIATQDNTQVTFGGNTTNLRSLEAFRIPYSYPVPTNIVSNNPVVVLYLLDSYMSMSFDAVMALPSIYKGTEFPIVPDPKNVPSSVEIYAFEDNTSVSLNGQAQTVIQAGTSAVIQVTAPSVIVTSKKTQAISGRQNYPYDPIAQIVPSNYFISSSRVLFHPLAHISSNDGFFGSDPFHTLVLVVPLASTGDISLDGTAISALQYKRIPNSRYYYISVVVSGAQHVITTTAPGAKYTASVYAYSLAKFNIGLDLA